MSEHTKEPWEVWTSNSNIRISADRRDGAVIHATTASDGIPILAIKEADARRLVACVNACEGLSNELLDNICMISGSIAGRFVEQRDYATKLEQQRDKLLAAAKNLRDVKGRYHSEQAMARLIETIAEVEASHD